MNTVQFIPEYMKKLPQWVVWRLEDTKKLPYSANYDGLASSTNSKTWCSYEKAVNTLKNGNYSGIGFVFSEIDNLTFIDLDHCFSNGVLLPLAQNILDNFNNTYVELSQSKSGIHIIACGSIPKSVKTAEVEIYNMGRYCAITGNAIFAKEPVDKQEQITTLWKWLDFKRNKGKKLIGKPKKFTALSLTMQEIIDKASNAKGGSVFQSLYSGNWQQLGIGDNTQSAADLSFANRLAFWTGCDEGMMCDIFRSSGLYRNERKMWLAIKEAVNGCGEIYQRRR